VVDYIKNQEEHHRHKSFQQEYLEVLREFEVQHDEQYVFKPIE